MKNYANIVLELMQRIQKLEDEVAKLKQIIFHYENNKCLSSLNTNIEAGCNITQDRKYLFEGGSYFKDELLLAVLNKIISEDEGFTYEDFLKRFSFGNDKLVVSYSEAQKQPDKYYAEEKQTLKFKEGSFCLQKDVRFLFFSKIKTAVKQIYGYDIKIDNRSYVVNAPKRYVFDGKNDLKKRTLVVAVIKKYMQDHPNVTGDELIFDFPKSVQGSLGIIQEKYNVDVRYENDEFEKRKRFACDEKDIVETADGKKFYICTQWTHLNIDNFVNHCKKLGYTIKAQ